MLRAFTFAEYKNSRSFSELLDWAKATLTKDSRESLVQIVALDQHGRCRFEVACVERHSERAGEFYTEVYAGESVIQEAANAA